MESISNPVILNSSGHYRSGHGDIDTYSSNHDEKEKILQIGLRNHCIFCLQKTGNANQTRSGIGACEQMRVIPRAKTEPQFLKGFNEVWQYLRKSKRVADNLEAREIPTFSSVPPICQGCANLTQILSSMLKTLELTVDEMKRKIRGARKGGENQWRFEFFEKNLRESTGFVDGRHIPFILKFIDFIDSRPPEVEEQETSLEVEVDVPLPVKRPRRSIRISKRSDPPALVGRGQTECSGDKEVEGPSTSSAEYTQVAVSPSKDNITNTSVDVTIVKSENNDDHEKEASIAYQPENDDVDMLESSLHGDDAQGEHASDLDYSPSEDETGDEQDPSYSETEMTNKTSDCKSSKSSSTSSKKTHEIIICEVKDCGKSCLGRKGYTCHKNLVHPETVTEKFPCSCGEEFLTKRRLMIHMKKNLATHPEYYSDLCKRKYICDICGVAMSNEQIVEHLKSHVGEEYVVKCPVDNCRYVFTNNDALLGHLIKMNCKSHPTGNISRTFILTCEACGYSAKNRMGLRGHVAINHERVAESEKKIKCPVDGCDKLFNVKQSVDLHLNTHAYLNSVTLKQSFKNCVKGTHLEKMDDKCNDQLSNIDQATKHFLCAQCECTCSSEKALLEHLFEHRHSNCLYCFICKDQVKYVRHFDLREHFSNVHQIECNEIICEECSESFWSKSNLRSHKEKHHSKKEEHVGEIEKKKTKKRHKCTDCPAEEDVGFATESGLISHKITMHGAEPFRCNKCDDSFTNVHAFSRHLKEHAGIEIKKWKCEVDGCGKAFRKRTALVYHKVAIHGEGGKRERTFVCDLCGKSFYNAKSLGVHHKGVHLGVKRFVCDECGDSFFQKTTLVYHLRRHTGERPFACPICDQRFRYKDVLDKHVKGHEKKGAAFKPKGPMKALRKRKAE